jgi:L-alanine-DL-glutamate epimerase-like enolase superfamily enzyme
VTTTIADLECAVYRVPLKRPWGPNVPCNYLITCRIVDSAGGIGEGFTWTPHIGAQAIYALLQHDCRDIALGSPTNPAPAWDRLWLALHEAGSSGVTTLAIAAIDTALWDLELRRRDMSLVDYLGPRRAEVTAYGSGINYDDSLEVLGEQARRWVAAGYRGVKIKVGHPSLEEDIDRVALVRQIVGTRCRLMIDANQRWSMDAAVRAIRALSRFDLHWVEEPLIADDVEGYARLRKQVNVPLAMGENQRNLFQFRHLILSQACEVIQPNVARVGGITPFLRIAALGAAHGVRVCPHHLPEISAQLAMCLPGEEMVEDIEDSSFAGLGVLRSSGIGIDGAVARLHGDSVGLGIRFAADRLQRFALQEADRPALQAAPPFASPSTTAGPDTS